MTKEKEQELLEEFIEYHKEVLQRIEETKASLCGLEYLDRQCVKEIMQQRLKAEA